MNASPGNVRLCLAARLFYPLYAGGALRFARYLPGLAARGIETTVFTATASAARNRMSGLDADGRSRAGERPPAEVLNGTPVHRVRLPDHRGDVARGAIFGLNLARFCKDPQHRPDVVQLVAALAPLVPALFRLRRMGVPVLSSVTVAPVWNEGIRGRLAAQAYVLPTRWVDGLVVSSDSLRDRLLGMGVAAPIAIIPNGVDTRRFQPAGRDDMRRTGVRRRLGIPQDALVLLTVGAVCPRKNHELLLEAWGELARRNPKLHLIVAGPRKDTADPGLDGFHRRIDALLDASTAADRVHFTGLVQDIEDYYRAADIFVFTSRREGMPNAVLEAMASALPVVTTPFVGLAPEIGTPGRDFLVAAFAANVFAAEVQALLDQAARRASIGRAARLWVEHHMALDHTLDAYAELYRRFAPARGVGRRAATSRPSGVENGALSTP